MRDGRHRHRAAIGAGKDIADTGRNGHNRGRSMIEARRRVLQAAMSAATGAGAA
jgi:hypothetical protein